MVLETKAGLIYYNRQVDYLYFPISQSLSPLQKQKGNLKMETNSQASSIEKSSQILWISDDLDSSDSGHIKSYTCAFCKRGFSNAQALGGHMNIHRKDRAKLRQFSDENLLSLDIAKAANPSIEAPNIVSEDRGAVILESSVQEKICTPKSKEEKMTKQLGESSSSSSHIDQYLDLELRLGPEPREASASRITKDLYRSSGH